LLACSLACNVCASLLTATFLLLCSFQINFFFFHFPYFSYFIFLILLLWNYFFLFSSLYFLLGFLIFFLCFNPHERTLSEPTIPVFLFARSSDPLDPSCVGAIFSHAVYRSVLKFEAPSSAETIAILVRQAI
jgi:hypothetical protein